MEGFQFLGIQSLRSARNEVRQFGNISELDALGEGLSEEEKNYQLLLSEKLNAAAEQDRRSSELLTLR